MNLSEIEPVKSDGSKMVPHRVTLNQSLNAVTVTHSVVHKGAGMQVNLYSPEWTKLLKSLYLCILCPVFILRQKYLKLNNSNVTFKSYIFCSLHLFQTFFFFSLVHYKTISWCPAGHWCLPVCRWRVNFMEPWSHRDPSCGFTTETSHMIRLVILHCSL